MKYVAFYLDWEEPRYDGYTDGATWNGWACPYFTKEVGLQIVADTQCDDVVFYYDESKDSFMWQQDTDNDEGYDEFKGRDIDGKHLYPIGAFCWVWNACDKSTKEIKEERLMAIKIFKSKLQDFYVAARDLNNVWDKVMNINTLEDIGDDDYPFDDYFNSIVHKINDWNESTNERY